MALSALVTRATKLAQDNSHTILTGVGVAGSISTAVLTGRAAFKAAHHLSEAPAQHTRRGMIEETWKFYIPPVAIGLITVTSIVLANRVAGKEAAAIAAAYAVSEQAFTEYREKVIEKIGEVKEGEVRDNIAEARMQTDPLNSREIILAGTGDVLCYDILSGRYFQSSKQEILAAENTVNYEIVNYMFCSLSRFYEEIGLPANGMSDEMGFNANRRCRVRFSAQVSSDGRPCLAIDFLELPVIGYSKLWD